MTAPWPPPRPAQPPVRPQGQPLGGWAPHYPPPPPGSGAIPWQQLSPPAAPRERGKATAFWLLPLLTLGLTAWAPALWAALRLHPRTQAQLQRRVRLFVFAAVYLLCSAIAWTTFGGAPEDAAGTPSGARADIGGTMLFALTGISTVHARRLRREVFGLDAPSPSIAVPGMAEALHRRQVREQYRELARRDPALAREMRVGRPDVPRNFEDGGLLSLNQLSEQALAAHSDLTAEEIADIVEVRTQRDGLVSIDDVVVFGRLTPQRADQLREYCVIL